MFDSASEHHRRVLRLHACKARDGRSVIRDAVHRCSKPTKGSFFVTKDFRCLCDSLGSSAGIALTTAVSDFLRLKHSCHNYGLLGRQRPHLTVNNDGPARSPGSSAFSHLRDRFDSTLCPDPTRCSIFSLVQNADRKDFRENSDVSVPLCLLCRRVDHTITQFAPLASPPDPANSSAISDPTGRGRAPPSKCSPASSNPPTARSSTVAE